VESVEKKETIQVSKILTNLLKIDLGLPAEQDKNK